MKMAMWHITIHFVVEGHIYHTSDTPFWSRTLFFSSVHLPSRFPETFLTLRVEVRGGEPASRLASMAGFTTGLQLGKAEVLRGLRNFLSTDRPGSHNTGCLKENLSGKKKKKWPTFYPPRLGTDMYST